MCVVFKWTYIEQESFEEIKQIVSKETLLVYLNFNNIFDIYTYASNYQLGAVIIQEGNPIDVYTGNIYIYNSVRTMYIRSNIRANYEDRP